MANTLTQIGIETGNIVEAYHVSQSIDAFTGTEAYDISLSGSFNMTGPINGEPGLVNPLTASYAITASYAKNALSASYALSSSFATTSSFATSASYALSSSFATSASYSVSSSYAITASHVPNTFTQNGNSFGTTAVLGTNDNQNLRFETSGSPHMYITTSGNVGIGQSSPQYKLDINTLTTEFNTPSFRVINSSNEGFYSVPRVGGPLDYFTLSATGDTAIIGSTGKNFIIGAGNAAAWKFLGTSSLPQPGQMYTDANVGIEVSNPTYLIHLGSDSAGKPGGGSWSDSSDERLKENIELADLDICYNVVKNLPLKRYRWKDNSYTNKQIVDRSVVGWIAQDVANVFPKAVNLKPFTQVDGTVLEDCLSLNETMINRTLYGAVQKLIQTNETLQTRIATLESELQAIKTHLGI